MGGPILNDWASHIVLACVTCENVILCTKDNTSWETKRQAVGNVISLVPVENFAAARSYHQIANIFLPTTCSSCSKNASWQSIALNKKYMETWQPYLAMCAFLEGDLSLLGLRSISLVHPDTVKKMITSDYIIRSAEINPTPKCAAYVHPHLQGGFL